MRKLNYKSKRYHCSRCKQEASPLPNQVCSWCKEKEKVRKRDQKVSCPSCGQPMAHTAKMCQKCHNGVVRTWKEVADLYNAMYPDEAPLTERVAKSCGERAFGKLRKMFSEKPELVQELREAMG